MLIGEAERFPELAQAWYASGPERSCAEFARWFAAWDRRGLLRVPDPHAGRPALQLAGAVHPAEQGHGVRERRAAVHPAELDHYADEAVRVFLAAYGIPRASS